MTALRPAVGYVRSASAMRSEPDGSIAAQLEVCTSAAQANGDQIIAWFEDRGMSGGTLDCREGLADCLDFLAENKEIRALYVRDVARLSRNIGDAVGLLRQLKGLGVDVIGSGVDGAAVAVGGTLNLMDDILSAVIEGVR